MQAVDDSPADLLVEGSIAYPPLLSRKRIVGQAVCVSVERFRCYGRDNLRFRFRVVEPAEFEGAVIPGYCAVRERLRPGSKLSKWVVTAADSRRVRSVTASLFKGALFEVAIEPTGRDAAAYSVVRAILRRVAG